MHEEKYMVCMRVDELDDPVEESTTTACVECGCDIWISVASRKQMSKVGAMPLCSHCAVRVSQEADETKIVPGDLSNEQFEEVVKRLRETHPELVKIIEDEHSDNFEAMKATARMASMHMTKPDQDWGSLVVMEDFDGVTFPPIPLGEMLNGGIPKEMIAKKLLPACVQASCAKRVLLGLSSWTLTGQEVPDNPISEHPDREEALVIIDITADGVQRMSTAKIIRDGVSPPKLGEWHDSEKPSGVDGLFVEALVPTLQLVRTLHAS